MSESNHDQPLIVPCERSALTVLLVRMAQVVSRELGYDLSRQELQDLSQATADAITTQEAYDGRHTDETPLGADSIMPLILARSAVLDRLASFRKSRRPRR